MKCPLTEGLCGSAKPDTFPFASKGARGTSFVTDERDNQALAVGVGRNGLSHPGQGVNLHFACYWS